MSPEAQQLLDLLTKNYKKSAFYSSNYTGYINRGEIPKAGIINNVIILPGDGYSKNGRSILLPVGAIIRIVFSTDTYKLGIGGTDTDKLQGLWASKFQYGYGLFHKFEPEGDFISI